MPLVDTFMSSDVVTTAWAMSSFNHQDPVLASRLLRKGKGEDARERSRSFSPNPLIPSPRDHSPFSPFLAM